MKHSTSALAELNTVIAGLSDTMRTALTDPRELRCARLVTLKALVRRGLVAGQQELTERGRDVAELLVAAGKREPEKAEPQDMPTVVTWHEEPSGLVDATGLRDLVDYVHPVTGASVRMWSGVEAVAVEWRPDGQPAHDQQSMTPSEIDAAIADGMLALDVDRRVVHKGVIVECVGPDTAVMTGWRGRVVSATRGPGGAGHVVMTFPQRPKEGTHSRTSTRLRVVDPAGMGRATISGSDVVHAWDGVIEQAGCGNRQSGEGRVVTLVDDVEQITCTERGCLPLYEMVEMSPDSDSGYRLLVGGREVGNVMRFGSLGWSGETEHGVVVDRIGGLAIEDERLAAAATVALWHHAEASAARSAAAERKEGLPVAEKLRVAAETVRVALVEAGPLLTPGAAGAAADLLRKLTERERVDAEQGARYAQREGLDVEVLDTRYRMRRSTPGTRSLDLYLRDGARVGTARQVKPGEWIAYRRLVNEQERFESFAQATRYLMDRGPESVAGA